MDSRRSCSTQKVKERSRRVLHLRRSLGNRFIVTSINPSSRPSLGVGDSFLLLSTTGESDLGTSPGRFPESVLTQERQEPLVESLYVNITERKEKSEGVQKTRSRDPSRGTFRSTSIHEMKSPKIPPQSPISPFGR